MLKVIFNVLTVKSWNLAADDQRWDQGILISDKQEATEYHLQTYTYTISHTSLCLLSVYNLIHVHSTSSKSILLSLMMLSVVVQ